MLSASNVGGMTAISTSGGWANVGSQGEVTNAPGVQSPYDLSQWMPSECEGCDVKCVVRGVDEDPSFLEAVRLAIDFSKHEACQKPRWTVQRIQMSKTSFKEWLSTSLDERSEMRNGEAAKEHGTEDGCFVSLGSTYIGNTNDLRHLVEENKRGWSESRVRSAKAQRNRLVLAILLIALIIGASYIVIRFSMQDIGSGGSEAALRARLQTFYTQYNPEKLSDNEHIDKLVRKYLGREAKLFARLSRKYKDAGL